MALKPKPPAEVTLDPARVRALLEAQHPDFAGLSLIEVASGWDNFVFRLGDDLAVRLPRRAIAAPLIEREARWLPELAPRLPLAVPVPVRVGHPSHAFPWAWSVVRWLPGETASTAPPTDANATAVVLGRFLRALHRAAPPDAPRSTWRGTPLEERSASVHAHLTQLDSRLDAPRIRAAWALLLERPPWNGPPLWLHGDLHPENLLVSDGQVTAVIDFGDLCCGDPATDLSVAWLLLPPTARATLRREARDPREPIDDHTWARARGWALALGLAYLANAEDDPALEALGQATIAAVLTDLDERGA
jgi:aminoglycoside phosphotransferase (APT) family kinase protein